MIEPCKPVRDRGKMTKDGWMPENARWIDVLAPKDRDGVRCGVNPMDLSLDVLTASGHPRRSSAKAVTGAIRGDLGPGPEIRRFTQLRQYCLGCAGSISAVRKCAIIECPVWPYRMGRNPHNPNRGKNAGIRPKMHGAEADQSAGAFEIGQDKGESYPQAKSVPAP